MQPPSTSTQLPRLAERLRASTREAHTGLEDALALLTPPLSRERFLSVLQGFRAFHKAWEPKVRAQLGADLAGRGDRLALLDRDIDALGGGPAPPCAFDLAFLADASAAWGSLYVVEGSTLGGRFISKALRGAPWTPAEGLAYFDPYGAGTGQMWARFKEDLEAAADLDRDAVVQGAEATFQALRVGLVRPLKAAA